MTTIKDLDIMSNGKWLYVNYPQKIHSPSQLNVLEVSTALRDDGRLQSSDIQGASLDDSGGWVIQCASPEIARRADGLTFTLQGRTATLTPFQAQAGGASVFIANHVGIGTTSRDIVEGIAQIELLRTRRIGFWVGLQEYKGIKGGKAVVVFDQLPGFRGMEIPVPISSSTEEESELELEETFRIRFSAVSPIDDRCPVCRRAGTGRHPITQCPMLRTVFIPSHDLPDKCFLLDQPPPPCPCPV